MWRVLGCVSSVDRSRQVVTWPFSSMMNAPSLLVPLANLNRLLAKPLYPVSGSLAVARTTAVPALVVPAWRVVLPLERAIVAFSLTFLMKTWMTVSPETWPPVVSSA
jgi:hypothetical protein